MSESTSQLKIGAALDGSFETATSTAKRKIGELGATANDAGKSLAGMGNGTAQSAQKIESATKSMIQSIQRTTAATEAGDKSSRAYQESLARMRGVDVAVLKPYLDALDAAKTAASDAASANEGASRSFFGVRASMLSAAAGIAAGFAGAGSAAFLFWKNINDGVDALNDLKDATGASIENISALEDVALRSGASFDTVSTSLIKFNGILKDAKPGSEAEQALKALGLSVADFKRLDPAEALRQTAVAMNSFADDGNKARIAQELFGKSLKDVAPFLKDLAEQGKLNAKVTTEQADEAEKFNKELFNMQKNITDVARDLAGPMVESINEVIKKFKEGREAGKGFFSVGWQNYKDGIGEFYGMQKNEGGSSGSWDNGATGSWGDPVKPSLAALPDMAAAKAAAAEAKKALAEQNKELSEQAKLLAELSGLTGSFSEDWNRLSTIYKSGKLSLEGLTKAQADLLAKQPFMKAKHDAEVKASKIMQDDYAQEVASINELSAAQVANDTARSNGIQAVTAYADSIKEQNEYSQLELSLMSSSATARAIALGQYKVELDLKKQIEAIDSNAGFDEAQRITQRARARAAAAQSMAGIETKVYTDEWKKTSDSINDTLTDALMRGFESGKDFARNLRDTVVNMFKTMVLRPVISAVMSPISGALMGGLGLSGAANAASAGGGALGAVGTGASIYNAIGLASTAMSQFGTAALVTTQNILGMGGTMAQMTQAAQVVAAGGQTAAMSIGSVAPYALAAVGALAAFGAFRTTKQTGTGISGTLGDDASLTGFNEMRKSGYLFGGPKYWDEIKALDPLMAKALKTDFANIKLAATGAADALGLASTKVSGFSKAFRIEFTGDKAKDEALYAGLMAGTADDLARTIIGSYTETIETVKSEIASGAHWDSGESLTSIITSQVTTSTYTPSEFAKEGETASQTLARLAGSISLVNQTSEMLGNALLEVGLSGANTASLLIDAFGGAESYAAQMGSYYTNFYDQAERTAFLTEKTTAAFTALGLTMPTLDAGARDAYRALVDTAAGQDMTVESNRKAYAALIALQGPMNELAPAFADAGQSIETFISDIVASAKSLREAISKSRFGQMDAESSLAQQQGDYATNYSMALSTTGTARVGYADKLASSLPDLVESIREGSGSRADWLRATSRAYAQAETVAGLLDADASALGYAAESVTLLTSISDSSTATADGMRALVTQLGGAPAFARGGYHKGGLRLVGEDGPELEVTGPSMIYNAAQMSGMGGGSNGALLAEMQALRFEVAQLRQDNSAENRAIVTHTQKSAGVLSGIEINGVEVRTDPSEAFVVEISA